jgi:hypothetical protein
MSDTSTIHFRWNAADAYDHFTHKQWAGVTTVPSGELFEVLALQKDRFFVMLGRTATNEVTVKISDINIDDKLLRFTDISVPAEVDDWYGIVHDPEPVVLLHGDVVFDVAKK